MKFFDTKRLSPVIYFGDTPHKYDLFWQSSKSIPDSAKNYRKFIKDKNIIIDEEWWEKQDYRCRHGYTIKNAIVPGGDCFVDGIDIELLPNGDKYIKRLDFIIKGNDLWISGKHYFYLNFWPIKRLDEKTGRKKVLNPKFTDVSWENWIIRENMLKFHKDNMFGKSRQKGLSEEEACDTFHEFAFNDDTQCVIVAGMEAYASNTMNFVIRGMEHLKNTQFYKELDINRVDYIKTLNTGSEIYCKTAKDNPQVLSSLSPRIVKFEEISIWKENLVLEVREFLEQSQFAEGVKTGYSTYIGTAGQSDKKGKKIEATSIKDMEELFYEPEKYGLLSMDNIYEGGDNIDRKVANFIPGWKFEFIDGDGNSFKEKSIESILQTRKKKNLKDRVIYIREKPIKPSEMFDSMGGGYFGDEIIQWLNERYTYINTHTSEQIVRTGRLEWNEPKKPKEGVHFVDDPKGWINILEEPETREVPLLDSFGRPTGKAKKEVYPNLYCSGTDSYDQDEANTSDSVGSCYFRKRFLDLDHSYELYVGEINERPSVSEGGAEQFYLHTIMGCIYFGNALNNIEYSNLRIFDYYINNGFEYLLRERPMIATANLVKRTLVSNRYGTDKSLKPHILAILKDQLTPEFINRMYFKKQIRALSRFKYNPGSKYNCDITIATAEAEVGAKDDVGIVVKRKEDINKKRGILMYKNVNGILQSVMT